MNHPHRSSTTALVLETNNLRGGAGSAEQVTVSLERLVRHLDRQSRPLSALDELVITHDGLDERQRARIEHAAGVPVQFVALPPGTGYYDAKNLGFDATSSDVVAFGDSDCWPDEAWLERLFAPFEGGASVVAGRTSYRDDVLGVAATSIDFMYFASPLGGDCTRNFYANNVAFRREVFAAHRYRSADGIYRGHCQRLGLELAAAGIPVLLVREAHTVHRFPDSAAELLRLRMLRGADTVAMAPHLADALLPMRFRRLGRLGPLSPMVVLACRLAFSARAVGQQGGERVRGARRAACLFAMAGISTADAVGALGRSVLALDYGVGDGAIREGALSYHHNVDALA
jgi:hypothetical protein